MENVDAINNDTKGQKSQGRYWVWTFLFLIILLTVVIRAGLLAVPLERDEGEYAYAGQLITWVHQFSGWVLPIVRRSEEHHFLVLPRRCVVERTFAWLGRHRRLPKDYEALPAASEALIYIAMIYLMLHRLAPG